MSLRVIAATVLGVGALAYAQSQPAPVTLAPSESSAPPPVKVATVFAQNAISSTQEGKKAASELSAKFQPRSDEFQRKQKELNTLRDQLRKGQAGMPPEAWRNLNATVETKTRDLQRLSEDSQSALDREEGVMLEQIGGKLQKILQDYATRNGFAVVFDVSVPNGPVLWASPAVDITNEIVKLYDQQYPAAAPAPSLPPAKK